MTAPNGRVTSSVYDEAGRLWKTIDNDVASPSLPTDDVTTTFYYDDLDRQTAVRHPTADGATTVVDRTTFNADGSVASEIRDCTDTGTTVPDEAGAPVCAGAGTKDADTNLITSYAYDSRGNRIRMTAPDPSATTGGSTATVTSQYALDDADRLCRVVEDATGSTDLQALTHPCSDATQTSGTATTNVSTRYTYDGAGNLASMIDAAGHTTSYGYDASGAPASRTDADSGVLVWKYDALGRQVRQENRTDAPMTASVTWTYDAAGRMLSRTADSITTTYTYDLSGNKLTASDGTLAITGTYDRDDRVLTVDDEDAGTTADTTYTYPTLLAPTRADVTGSYAFTLDKLDHVTAVNDPVMASDFTTTYRADGQPKLISRPDGNYTELTYDKLGGALGSDTDTSATPGAGTDRAVYGWTRNRAGQILTEAATVTGDASNGTVTYSYDPLGRLSSSALSGTTTSYGWDAVPNRTSVQVGAGGIASQDDRRGRLAAPMTQRGEHPKHYNWLIDEATRSALADRRVAAMLGAHAKRTHRMKRRHDFVRYVPPKLRAVPHLYHGVVGVIRVPPPDAHWLWTGAMKRFRSSYFDEAGVFQTVEVRPPEPTINLVDRTGRHTVSARRVYYVDAYGVGPVVTGLWGRRWQIVNRCGVPECVNPEHSEEIVPAHATDWDRERADQAARRVLPTRPPPPPPPARDTLYQIYVTACGDTTRAAKECGVTRQRFARWVLDARFDDEQLARDLDVARAVARRLIP